MQHADAETGAVAERLHAAAIRLIRHVRVADTRSRTSPAKLSVLSILAFVGPRSLMQLANAEQVRAPTMSRLVADLETEGLVDKRPGGTDRRLISIRLTSAGRRLMEESRRRRLTMLQRGFADFTPAELKTLSDAAELMLRATRAGD